MIDNTSQTEPSSDLSPLCRCETEQFLLPGSVQPHGVWLIVSEPDLTVIQTSTNTDSLLDIGYKQVLESPLDQVIGIDNTRKIGHLLDQPGGIRPTPVILDLPGSEGRRLLLALVHRHQDVACIEIEPFAPEDPEIMTKTLAALGNITARLDSGATAESACQIAVEEIRSLTGYDRVIAYGFDAQWNGSVIGEARADSVGVFLGLHFPASDIPRPVRELYLQQKVRLIPDCEKSPVDVTPVLHPPTAQPVDMSYCQLRSLSPMHQEYLRTLQVRATLVASIVGDGKLWGLIMCHHSTPKFLPFGLRMLIGEIADRLASRIVTLETKKRAEDEKKIGHAVRVITNEIATSGGYFENTAVLSRLPDVIEASGVAFVQGKNCVTYGITPPESAIYALINVLKPHSAAGVCSTDCSGRLDARFQSLTDVAAGVLMVNLEIPRDGYVLWFRSEHPRTTTWAGDPHQWARAADDSKQPPFRRTFEAWREHIQGTSLPWTEADIMLARALGSVVTDAQVLFQSRFFDHTFDAIILMDRRGNITDWNRGAERIFGVPQAQAVSRSIETFFRVSDRRLLRESIDIALRKGSSWTDELGFLHADGKEKIGRLTIQKMSSPHGDRIGLTCVVCDITENYETQRRARHSEKRFKLLVQNSSDVICVVDLATVCRFVSNSVHRILGYTPEEIIGKSIFDGVHPEDLELTRAAFREILNQPGSPIHTELRYQHKNGKLINIDLVGELPAETNDIGGIIVNLRDVTALRRSEAEQHAREVTLRTFFDGAPFRMGVMELFDDDVGFVSVNSRFARPFQRRPQDIEGRTAKSLGMPTEDLAEWLAWFQEVWSQKEAVVYEKMKSETRRWFRTTIAPIVGDGGEKPRFCVIIEDITKRRRREDRMRLLESAVEHVNDGIVITETGSTAPLGPQVIYANPAFERLTGRSREEVIGQTPWAAGNLSISPEQLESIQKAITNWEAISIEFLTSRKDGTEFWSDWNMVPVANEKGWYTHWIAVQRDVTSRKQAELALRENEERFRTLADSAPVSIWIADETGMLIWFSRSWLEFSGRRLEQELDNGWIETIHPEDRDTFLAHYRTAFASRNRFTFEFRLQRHDGEYRTVLNSGVPRFSTGGHFAGYVGTCVDVTDLKQAEEERHRIARLEGLGTLAAGIAHDFNNILTSILGNLSLARRPGSSEKLGQRLKEAEHAIHRARRLTQQLLTFSKGGEPVKERVDLATLLRETCEFSLRGSNVELLFSLPANLPAADADPGQISQVVQNLVLNAREAMPEGGRLVVSAESIAIDDQKSPGLAPGRYIRISFADQGVGIPPERLGKIFDPYFTTKQTGHGLGLAVVFSILTKHGGHVAVRSQPGFGTIFDVYLPALAAETPASGELETPITLPKSLRRALVVDDDTLLHEVFQEMLHELGVKAEITNQGRYAIEVFRHALATGTPFDVVLLDLTMPGGFGGIKILKELREIDPKAKVIVCSGYAQDPVLSRPHDFGFSGRLCKPFTFEELNAALEEAMESAL